jgi:transposase
VGFIEGTDRGQVNLLPACVEDYVAPDAMVRFVRCICRELKLSELGFSRTVAAATGRPGFHPGDMLRLYIWGYLNPPNPVVARSRDRRVQEGGPRPFPTRVARDALRQ